jgi:hypothetical protein
VTIVTHEHQLPTLARVPFHFAVNLGDQWAHRIISDQAALLGVLRDPGRNAMGREQNHTARRHLRKVFNKDGAFSLEPPHDLHVVDDRAPHVDGCAMMRQGVADRVDGPSNACAKTARRCKKHLDRRP